MMKPRQTEAFAPAKVNLALHVTGRRADGYHLLDSLVVFADLGDWLRARAAPDLRLDLSGPQAGRVPPGPENLVLRAARLLAGKGDGALLTLEKHLPVAAGIGGGSSDAAAALRALALLWGRSLPDAGAVLSLGADLPVCLAAAPCRMRGIGGVLDKIPPLPPAWLVLANPGVEITTPAIFAALERRDWPALPATLPRWRDAAELAAWLRMTRNDLEAPARAVQPVIGEVIDALTARPGCLTARMSGSGATCYGLFAEPLAAAIAARAIAEARPGWWVAHAPLLQRAPADA